MEKWIGLRAAKRVLRGVFASGSTVHALLLYGEEGCGKSLVAEALAAFWLCQTPSELGACGACASCRTLEKGNAVDRLLVVPTGNSNIIKVSAIRPSDEPPDEPVVPIETFLRTRPIQARSKVVLMQQADRMNDAASNSLLKILEEPPEYGRFILCASESSRVRPTIRSRCLATPCELPSLEEWREAFGELAPWEEALARRAPGRLARLRAHPEPFQAIYQVGTDCLTLPPERALAIADRFRRAVDALAKNEDVNARMAGTIALDALGASLFALGAPAGALGRITLAHRRIVGNVGAGYEFDALFVRLMAQNRTKLSSKTGVLA